MVEFIKWVGVLAGWVGLLGGLVSGLWLLLSPKAAEALIGHVAYRVKRHQEEADKHRLEEVKADLAKELERVKADFAGTLEEKKSELGRLSSRVQHDLQREVIRAESQIQSLHRVYPTLGKKFHIALGGIGQGASVAYVSPQYERMSQDEQWRAASLFELSDADMRELLSQIEKKSDKAVKLLDKYRRTKQLEDGNQKRKEAVNYMLIKRLYLSDEVLAKCESLDTLLVSIYVGARMWIWETFDSATIKKSMEESERAVNLLREIDMQMREELRPKD